MYSIFNYGNEDYSSSCTVLSFFSFLETNKILNPLSASSKANPFPIPEVEPVIQAKVFSPGSEHLSFKFLPLLIQYL